MENLMETCWTKQEKPGSQQFILANWYLRSHSTFKAGVSASKVKVVINTDPEAPFFKAADYGIVVMLYEVVSKLIEKIKEFKAPKRLIFVKLCPLKGLLKVYLVCP